VLCVVLFGVAGCSWAPRPLLLELAEAQRLSADLRAKFVQASDASNRAVMADTDEASVAFAKEAAQARKSVQADLDALRPLLEAASLAPELEQLKEFTRHWGEYQTFDQGLLALAVENTNLKAQHLSFGPAREAADAFKRAVTAASQKASAKNRCQADSLTGAAVLAVREMQVLHAPHIAEATDDAMALLEHQLEGLAAEARRSLAALPALVDSSSQPDLKTATTALDQFLAVQSQIVALSRKNTNVRSLAMSLGPKVALTQSCLDSLKTLEETLAGEAPKARK
jgi:hypothetical protein